MDPESDRRVRIARPGQGASPHPVRFAVPPEPGVRPEESAPPAVPNRSGIERARRLALTYLVGLAAIFLLFALLSRYSSAGGSIGAVDDLEMFGAIAVALGGIGAGLSLLSAPVAIERPPGELVVHGRLGYRRRFEDGAGLSVRVLRRYPAGWLSSEPVDSVEIATRGVRRTYLIESGLVPERTPHPVGE